VRSSASPTRPHNDAGAEQRDLLRSPSDEAGDDDEPAGLYQPPPQGHARLPQAASLRAALTARVTPTKEHTHTRAHTHFLNQRHVFSSIDLFRFQLLPPPTTNFE